MSNGNDNNHANQMNPNNPAHNGSRQGSGDGQAARDNRANQMNPNHSPSKSGNGGGGRRR